MNILQNKSKVLRYITATTISNEDCDKRYPYFHNLNITKLCILSDRKGDGLMSGDSGGPLIYNNTLIGDLSFGQKDLAVFARVSHFASWIDETMHRMLFDDIDN